MRSGKGIMRQRQLLWLICFAMLIGMAADPGRSFGQTIKLGIPGPMKFEPGEQLWRGATLATEEINAAGGIKVKGTQYKIELVKGDTNEMVSVSDAVNTLEKLITVDKVNFLVGGFRSEAVLAMQEVMASHRILFIGTGGAVHTSLNERLAENYNKYKYWFRVSAINSMYMGASNFAQLDMVKAAVTRELGIKNPKVAILCEKALWVDPIVKAAEERFPKMGMEVVGVWRPSPLSTDLTAELTGIRAAGAQLIFVMLTGPVGVVFSRQWGELQIPAAPAGSNIEGMSKRHWGATGGMCEYEVTWQWYGRVAITEKTIPFLDKYLKKFDDYPTHPSATYDGIYLLKEAIERAGTLETDAVIAELEKTDYRGALGRIVFNPRESKWPHDIIWGPGYATALAVQWINGNQVVVWPDGGPVLGNEKWVGVRYKGTVDYKLPPWMIKYWKSKR